MEVKATGAMGTMGGLGTMDVGAIGMGGMTGVAKRVEDDKRLAGKGVDDEAMGVDNAVTLVDEGGTAGKDNKEAMAAEIFLDDDDVKLGGGEALVMTTGGGEEADKAGTLLARGGAA